MAVLSLIGGGGGRPERFPHLGAPRVSLCILAFNCHYNYCLARIMVSPGRALNGSLTALFHLPPLQEGPVGLCLEAHLYTPPGTPLPPTHCASHPTPPPPQDRPVPPTPITRGARGAVPQTYTFGNPPPTPYIPPPPITHHPPTHPSTPPAGRSCSTYPSHKRGPWGCACWRLCARRAR